MSNQITVEELEAIAGESLRPMVTILSNLIVAHLHEEVSCLRLVAYLSKVEGLTVSHNFDPGTQMWWVCAALDRNHPQGEEEGYKPMTDKELEALARELRKSSNLPPASFSLLPDDDSF